MLVSPPALGAEFNKTRERDLWVEGLTVVPVESSKAMDAWVASENYTVPGAHGKVPLNSSKVPRRWEAVARGVPTSKRSRGFARWGLATRNRNFPTL